MNNKMFNKYLTWSMPLVLVNQVFASPELEEVTIVAQKHESSLQDTPIAVSVLNDEQLDIMDINGIDDLAFGIIPSLRADPPGNSPSSFTVAIRGDGVADLAQPMRQGTVAIYLDGIYLGRAQGLNTELADLEQIEVLRGPQGTLFGRNSTSGAINIISKKPSGEFGIKQKLVIGSYNQRQSETTVNLTEARNVKAKLDYIISKRDGWVENKDSSESDYNEYDKRGGRLAIDWSPSEEVNINYVYDQSNNNTAQIYVQAYDDFFGAIGEERSRENKSRYPIELNPVDVDVEGHAISATWTLSDNLILRSLSSVRELDENGFNNYGGVLYGRGLVLDEDITQEQYSQEFQLLGSTNDVDWVAGLYYFKENTTFDFRTLTTLDANFNQIPIDNTVPFLPFTGKAKSIAAYAHTTWTVNKLVNIDAGIRHTQDDKSARRAGIASTDISPTATDGSLSVNYNFSDDVTSYLKWSTAYRAGGYNVRSVTFAPYDDEKVETWELGLKSEWFDRRVRMNAAAFHSEYSDKQFDFASPTQQFVSETLNALKSVEITGFEGELTVIPVTGLRVGLSYTYLDGDTPLQPHPELPGTLQRFELIQTPQHAGSLSLDYVMPPFSIGQLSFHLDVTATDQYSYSTTPDTHQDSYSLINAKITLADINVNNSHLNISLWGKNLADEEYIILSHPNPPVTNVVAFGEPRTAGIEVSFNM
jgi:iron complex outermembrane recepter protein